MFTSTDALAEKLIAISEMRRENYLERVHLDPAPLVWVYVRRLALRHALRRVRRNLQSAYFTAH
jgi:hypothetical protein